MNQQNAQNQSTAGQQTDLLFGLIHVGPKLLRQFIDTSRASLDSITAQLKGARDDADLRIVIDSALRIVHGIKGSASLFDLTLYVRIAHQFEDRLRRLQGGDTREIQAEIGELIARFGQALDETALLLEPLSWFRSITDERISRTQAFLTGAALLVEELARDHNISAALYHADFDLESVPAGYSQDLVDILTQMLRNAVVHGIEPPNERQESGKPVKGRIYLTSRHTAHCYCFSVQDDGRGLNPTDLKAAIAASATFCRQSTDNMTMTALAAFLFEPGFTTSRSPSHSSGSGMGLNLAVRKISSLSGRLEFVFTRGKGCRFDVILPAIGARRR